jgi:tetratricopeptide (TPR) repeat protein
LYLAVTIGPAGLAQAPDPDALYRQRENIAAAKQAADIWGGRAAGGTDFESAWKLARACYWIGTHAPDAERRVALDRGVKAGEQAVKLNAGKPEGHFWLAANMGALAESFGMWQGLKYRGRIKDALEQALKIDPAWQQGSADRALGRWYFRVPGLFGGSTAKAKEHLQRALNYNPNSTVTLFFLADVAIEERKYADARTLLQRVLDAPEDPEWGPEDRDFKRQAREKLSALPAKDAPESVRGTQYAGTRNLYRVSFL